MSSQTSLSAVIPSVLADDGGSGGNDAPLNRSDPDRWYFPKEKLESTPSRRQGIDPDKELTYRQQSANFIQDIGQRLQVNQLCINTAIVYMHRFYMFHSFTHFHRNAISAASIFLAAKVEEQPRKLEHVIKVAHYCLHRDHQPAIDAKSEQYLEQSAELVMNENILLQTLGFDVAIDHPHTHVVKCCQLVRASKDLAQTSYFMATNSLHLTTMCLQYKPTVVACVCIHLACKWSSWEIPRSKEGKDWFWYVDDTVTSELLEKLTTDFLVIFNKSPSRLKKKINSLNNAASSSSLSLKDMGYHGLESSPGQHQGRSRSPSPKRPQASLKSNSQQPGVPGKPKPHGMQIPHHSAMKMPYPPVAPGSSANKHLAHPPHGHSSSSKQPHPGMPPGNMKDPHHPHHPPPHGKNPYPPHGHGQHSHGQYPHGSRPGMQSSSGSSSQPHHGHGVHSKPPASGSSSSSHPYSSSSSSSSMKNMQTLNPSKPPHNMSSSGAPKMPPNQAPGAVKNPSQPMFHSSQSHMKKPYEARPDFGLPKREGPPSGSLHHSQNHARTHEKLLDGRHHSSASGMQPSHSSSSQSTSNDSRDGPHHNMPYLGQDVESRAVGGNSSSSSQKLPYMESMSRHRMPPSSNDPSKRGLSSSHGASAAATNGNNNDNMSALSSASGGPGSSSGAGDSHVPSKNAYRANQPPSSSSSIFGQNSQMEMGASKYGHADGFGGEFSSIFDSSSRSSSSSSSSVMSIEDRRKRRLAEGIPTGSSMNSSKRARSDAYMPSVPISNNSLFSPEEIAEASLTNSSSSSSSKRLPPLTSQFSPSALDGTAQPNYGSSKLADRSHLGAGNPSLEGIVFGSSAETKPDIRSSRINPPSVEFQATSLLQPISDSKSESLLSGVGGSNAPRAASLFSPEFTPSNTIPSDVKISPPTPLTSTSNTTDIHSKRDMLFSNMKQETGGDIAGVSQNQHVSNSYSDGGSSSQSGLTGRLSGSPTKREDGEDSHKKSKKSKKEKHKHKHKDEKKHKKDKHKDKEKEKDKEKKDKHRSKEKHSSSSISSAPPPVDIPNDVVSSHKIKIKLPRGDESSKSATGSAPSLSSSSAKTRHSSSNKLSNSSSSAATTGSNPPLPGLKVKISNKGRVSSVDDDAKHGGGGSPGDHDTPCCPGFGPCLTCNRDSSQDHQPDHYRFFSSAPSTGLTMKFAKSKESSKSSSSKESSSKDSKKSKEKSSKSSSSGNNSSVYNNSMPMVMSSGSRLPSLSSSHHMHKNGMEKSSKKKDKSAV